MSEKVLTKEIAEELLKRPKVLTKEIVEELLKSESPRPLWYAVQGALRIDDAAAQSPVQM
jgi:hypothetical protein